MDVETFARNFYELAPDFPNVVHHSKVEHLISCSNQALRVFIEIFSEQTEIFVYKLSVSKCVQYQMNFNCLLEVWHVFICARRHNFHWHLNATVEEKCSRFYELMIFFCWFLAPKKCSFLVPTQGEHPNNHRILPVLSTLKHTYASVITTRPAASSFDLRLFTLLLHRFERVALIVVWKQKRT